MLTAMEGFKNHFNTPQVQLTSLLTKSIITPTNFINTSTGSSRSNKRTPVPAILSYLTLARTDTSKYLSLLTGTADTVFTQDIFKL